MTTQEFINTLLARAKSAGFSAAEAHYVERDSFAVRVQDGEIDNYAVNKTRSISFRGIYQGKMGNAASEALDEAAIDLLVDLAKENAMLIEDEAEQFIFAGSESYQTVNCYEPELEKITPEEKIAFARELEKVTLAADPRVAQVQNCAVTSGSSQEIIANSTGLYLSHQANQITAGVVPVVREAGMAANERASKTTRNFAELDAPALAAKAVQKSLRALGGEPIPSALVDVVLEPEIAASLLSSFSSIFSADAAQKGRSLYKGKVGEMVAAPCLTLKDDPLMPEGFSSRPFDSEGVAVQTKEVIQAGRLTTLLHNLQTAAKDGVASTGNAASGGRASIAPFNFYITAAEPGTEKSKEELYAAVGEGLLVTRFDGMNAGVNPISGDFSLSTKGVRIQNGKLTTPVAQVTLAGNFYNLLQQVAAVGDDLTFNSPSMASFGCPSLLVKGLSIAGK
ncbi:MAG: TldD/PmbA family protein [Symbiobacteriaceae bacterium]|nr:TldD/PmbA family protein [Symbiobacteriaceae bacterium]